MGHWNSWFNANLYLQDRAKWPLQLVLRNILIEGSNLDLGGAVVADYEMLAKSLKAAMVIVTTVPIFITSSEISVKTRKPQRRSLPSPRCGFLARLPSPEKECGKNKNNACIRMGFMVLFCESRVQAGCEEIE